MSSALKPGAAVWVLTGDFASVGRVVGIVPRSGAFNRGEVDRYIVQEEGFQTYRALSPDKVLPRETI